MDGNDLTFLSGSPDALLATTPLLPTSAMPIATPRYSVIESSSPSKQPTHLSSKSTGINKKPRVSKLQNENH